MAKSEYEIIFTQRHPVLESKDSAKDSIWKLIYNSYIGGKEYKDAEYLIKYPKESLKNFEQRQKRAVYFNQLSPIVDMLSGMLFLNEPKREIPKELEFFRNTTSPNKKINEFMRIYAAHTLMFTCAVLIDMPNFDPEKVKTKKDVIDQNILPYAVIYLPFRIRDFYIGEDGDLDWIVLDNSYYEHQDPLQEGVEVKLYRLWTRNTYRDFKIVEGVATALDEVNHGLGRVPVRLDSWRDDNSDFVGETIFEDIAMISKLIYNSMSYMDEMLASGTFKMLSYPTKDGALPEQITAGGLGPLSAIPYDMASTNKPEFIGATLGDIDSFVKAMQFYMTEILKKVGLSTDETKEFVKSGVAKKIDFQKMRALLVSGAQAMGRAEEWMFETASLWIKRKDKVSSKYTSDYSSEELYSEVQMLNEMMVYPVSILRQNILQVLVKKLLSNNLSSETIEEINKAIVKDIKSSDSVQKVDPKIAAETIKAKQVQNKQQEV